MQRAALQSKESSQNCKDLFKQKLLRNTLTINALQNLLFCIPKAALLHGKSVGFALQNSRFRSAKSKLAFFFGIILTKQLLFSEITFTKGKENKSPKSISSFSLNLSNKPME
ncbi:MAG: hypothetical protein ACTTI1_08765, partial [Prevotella intermedia]